VIETLVVYGHGISIFGLDFFFWISRDGYGFVGVYLTGWIDKVFGFGMRRTVFW